MREIIVLDDDDEEALPSSQAQRGLTEEQKLRMLQQKQLALARLQAKNLRQTQLPFSTSVNPKTVSPQVNSTSAEPGNRSCTGGFENVEGTSMGNGCGDTASRVVWQHPSIPSQRFYKYPASEGTLSQQFLFTPPSFEDRRWTDRIEARHSPAGPVLRDDCSEGIVNSGNCPFSCTTARLNSCNPLQSSPRELGQGSEDVERQRELRSWPERRCSTESTTQVYRDTMTNRFHPRRISVTEHTAERIDCRIEDRNPRETKGDQHLGEIESVTNSHSQFNGFKRKLESVDPQFNQDNPARAASIMAWGPSQFDHCSPRNSKMEQDSGDKGFHEGTQEVSRPSELQKGLRQPARELIGEWRSVRKTPAAGSSFGLKIAAQRLYEDFSEPEAEPWKFFRSQKSPVGAESGIQTFVFDKQVSGYGLPEPRRLHESELQKPSNQWSEHPTASVSHALPGRAMWAENTRTVLPGAPLQEKLVLSEQQVLPGPPPKEKPVPSTQQMQVLKAIAQAKSVFVTGSAGTGKSFIVEDALQILRRMYGEDAVFVTASTGLAACALGGTTLHSFAGIGMGAENQTKEELADRVCKKREIKARWLKARALIIDEISMVDGDLFDKLEYLARRARTGAGLDRPWGGLQLIVTGDFFQLEPVKPKNPQKYFAFQAECWERSFQVQVELTHVFRQSDSEFIRMLNEIRRGVCSPSTLHRLRQCHGPSDSHSMGIEMTRLYPHQTDVRRENDQNLRALGLVTIVYKAKDDARNDFGHRQLENVRAAAVQPLCVGAQVMLLKNLDSPIGLVNGARGVVVRFSAPDDATASEYQKLAQHINPSNQWPIVRFACDGLERLVGPESWSIMDGDKEVAKRTQIPLMLAWALSVHKCQGMTLDRVETNLSRAFGHGMVYVALSRVKSLEGLRLIGFDPSRIKTLPVVAKFYEDLNKNRC